MKTKEQFIQANGHQINTQLIGEIDSDKPTLLFIHGGLDCIAMWREFPMQLCEQTGLCGIVYERWGHGKSDMLVLPREGDARAVEADQPLKDLFQHFAVGKVILVGHSFGGGISLIAASIHQDTICGAVVIAPQLTTAGDTKAGLEKAIAAFENGKLRDGLLKFHGENTDILFRGWSTPSSTFGDAQPDYSDQLRTITCPVLDIYGTADNYGYLHNLEMTNSCLSCAHDSVEIEGSTHYPHLDTPEPVLEAAVKFIGNISG